MKKNIGGMGRVIRTIAGLAILTLAFVGPKSAWAYLGVMPLVVGLTGWCPLFGSCKSCK